MLPESDGGLGDSSEDGLLQSTVQRLKSPSQQVLRKAAEALTQGTGGHPGWQEVDGGAVGHQRVGDQRRRHLAQIL